MSGQAGSETHTIPLESWFCHRPAYNPSSGEGSEGQDYPPLFSEFKPELQGSLNYAGPCLKMAKTNTKQKKATTTALTVAHSVSVD